MNTRVVRYVLVLLGLGVLVVLARRADLGAVASVALWRRAWPALCGAALLVVANVLLKAWRWRLMSDRVGAGPRVSLSFCVASVVSGVAAASLFPGRLVDAAKPLMLSERYQVPLKSAGAAMLVERLLDLGALGAVLAASAAMVRPIALPKAAGALSEGVGAAAWVAGGAAVVVGVIAWRLWGATAAATAAGAARHGHPAGGGGWGAIAGLSVAATALEVLRAWVVYGAVGIRASLPVAGLAFGGSAAAGLASFVPGGLGIVEAAQAYLLSAAGTGGARGAASAPAAAAILDRLLSYYLLVLAGGVIILWNGMARRRGRGGAAGSSAMWKE